MLSVKVKRFVRVAFVVVGALALTACASRYPESIRTENKQLVPFGQVMQSDAVGVGQEVRWGGLIAEVTNTESTSVIEIVQMDLKASGRPVVDENSAGRFRIQVNGFIDPKVYTSGRLVTVLGRYTGKQEDKIGEFVYKFPMVESQGLHLWKVVEESKQVDVMIQYGIGHPFYRDPFYGPRYYRVRETPAKGNNAATQPPQNKTPSVHQFQ